MTLKYKKTISWEKFLYPEENEEGDDTEWSSDKENLISMKTFVPRHAHFNFWIAHCSFPITYRLAPKFEEICDLPGVEGLKISSRYRFMMAVAKNPSFDESKVKLAVTTILCKEDE